MSLVARYLEEHGLPTIVFGCARDIVEHCGVPRFVFTDFPLGNPTGRPFDPECQRHIVSMGLDLLERATAPRATDAAPARTRIHPPVPHSSRSAGSPHFPRRSIFDSPTATIPRSQRSEDSCDAAASPGGRKKREARRSSVERIRDHRAATP